MEEIKVYYDAERKNEVKGDIEFEPVEAGKKSKRELYFLNAINFDLNMEISIEGPGIKITESIKDIIPGQLKMLDFELSPKLTTMKPIKAKLKIKLEYTVR